MCKGLLRNPGSGTRGLGDEKVTRHVVAGLRSLHVMSPAVCAGASECKFAVFGADVNENSREGGLQPLSVLSSHEELPSATASLTRTMCLKTQTCSLGVVAYRGNVPGVL